MNLKLKTSIDKTFIGIPGTRKPQVAPERQRRETRRRALRLRQPILEYQEERSGELGKCSPSWLTSSNFFGFRSVAATFPGVGGSVLHLFDSLAGTIIHEKGLIHQQNSHLYIQRHSVSGRFRCGWPGGERSNHLDQCRTIYWINGMGRGLVWV